jgi:DNA-binding transcriptional MocR family regulator
VVSVVTVMSDGSTVETMTVGCRGRRGRRAPPGRADRLRARHRPGGRGVAADRGRPACGSWRALPKLRRRLQAYSQQQLAEAQQTGACNALHNLEPRMAKWLLRCHDRVEGDLIALTQEFLSDMLGAQRTTVTQVAGNLQNAGLIRYQRGRIAVLDRRALERISCECYRVIRDRGDELGLG